MLNLICISNRFHDGLILFQFDTIAPNLVPSVSNDLVQMSEWEQMKKVPKSEIDFLHDVILISLNRRKLTDSYIFSRMQN